jgi:CRP-like cAMP-binding protein
VFTHGGGTMSSTDSSLHPRLLQLARPQVSKPDSKGCSSRICAWLGGATKDSQSESSGITSERQLARYGSGGIVGELDFYMQCPRSFFARASSLSTVAVLTRRSLRKIEQQEPRLAVALQSAVLTSLCLTVSNNLVNEHA